MLIDEVAIIVKAGNGGDGAVSLRREKYVSKGGPDGGDGGKGGDVRFVATHSAHGLGRFQGQKDFKAQDGERGGKSLKHGKNGEDLFLSVPVGTRIKRVEADGSQRLVTDLATDGQEIVIDRGGRGGRGNWYFRSATNQTPMDAQPGVIRNQVKLILELQLIADVGLIGVPNAGKSTLLSVISAARPKIADYPFTTLEPNLGTVFYHDTTFVVADIPGLIAGASVGKGLGREFLKHVKRTQILVHLISVTDSDPDSTYRTVRAELDTFDASLSRKLEIVVLSQIDLLPEYKEMHADFIAAHNVLGISAITHAGVDDLLAAVAKCLKR